MNQNSLERRSFCRALAGATAGLAFSRTGWADEDVASVNLSARSEWLNVAGRSLNLYTYERQYPGPAIRIKPGNRLVIKFLNLLTEPTNLHFHGLHIPSTGSADNSFLRIERGQSFTYDFEIPQNHPGGTFWYHPHHHGMAAKQLSRGLAGMIIVRGVLDEIPEIAQAPESLLMLQDFAVNGQGVPTEPGMMERMQGREGALILINGQLNPAFAINRNGWLRLRIVNASASRFYRLRIEDHMMYQIASDGGALPTVRELDELLLTPGERAEIMIRGEREPGEYRILNLPYDRGRMGMMGMRVAPSSSGPIGSLRYEGEAESEWTLPHSLATVEPLPEPEVRRYFRLDESMMEFTINRRPFDARRTDTSVRLNAIEEWEFDNPTDMDHPMHIHTNPFQVVGTDGRVIPEWKDVTLVKSRARVRVRMRFDDFTGPTLYHCHILDHEDLGMMGRLDILS